MMARTHVAVGAGLCLAAVDAGLFPGDVVSVLAGVSGAAVGALLPDLDHPKSMLGRQLPFISLPLSKIFGHRGITHSLLAVAGVLAAGLHAAEAMPWSPWLVALVQGAALGYLSHLLADAFNPAGVPLLYPSWKRFRFPLTCRPGGPLESILFYSACAGCALSVFAILPNLRIL